MRSAATDRIIDLLPLREVPLRENDHFAVELVGREVWKEGRGGKCRVLCLGLAGQGIEKSRSSFKRQASSSIPSDGQRDSKVSQRDRIEGK